MNKKILLIAIIVVALMFAANVAFAQSLPSGYDENEEVQTISLNQEGAGTTFVQDLEEIRRRRINEIIEKIRQGNPNALRFVVYDVFEEVHREAIRRAREGKSNVYAVYNMNNAIPAFIGGFDNQDPKVRLRCIGWLGDWVDEIGLDLADILKRTRDRIVSRIETREEVKYALKLLELKIVRKTILNRVFNGDEKVLEQITAQEFIVLIHNELFLREVYCVSKDILIRSIRLAPWWIDIKMLELIVASRLQLTKRLNDERYTEVYVNTNFVTPTKGLLNRDEEEAEKMQNDYLILPLLPTGYDVYRLKTTDDDLADKREFELLKTYYYDANGELQYFIGYLDHAGNWDIQTLYDIRYFNYSQTGQAFENEDKYIRALFGGLRNRHQVVRENCARILVMLSDPYVRLDLSRRVTGADGMLDILSKESRYATTAMNAWEEVRFSQYVDVARPAVAGANVGQAVPVVYYGIDGTMIDYNRTYLINNQVNPWGYLWTYRIDMHELLRRMGLGQLFACDIGDKKPKPQVQPVSTDNTYFVESLFDLTSIDVNDGHDPIFGVFDLIPDWHGVDEIEDEIFNP
jgi:hypothetical protein